MVNVDPATKREFKSRFFEVTTARKADAVRLSGKGGSTLVLDAPGTTYVLTEDITTDSSAIRITAANVTTTIWTRAATSSFRTSRRKRVRSSTGASSCTGSSSRARRRGIAGSTTPSSRTTCS
jgi:hypothetical protein